MTLKSEGSVFTHAHIPLPNWRQSHDSSSDAVDITLRKLDGISCQRSTARRINGASAVDVTPIMTSRQYDKRAISFLSDVRFQDGDVVDLNEMGYRFLSSSPSFFHGLNLR